MRIRLIVGLVAAVACFALAAAVAEASFPGRNGRIAFARMGANGSTLWSVDPAAGRARRLTAVSRLAQCHKGRKRWFDEQPSYSASGRLIVYYHRDSCDPRYPDGVYSVGGDGTQRQVILREDQRDEGRDAWAGWVGWPALSPSGRLLAFGTEGFEPFITTFPRPLPAETRLLHEAPWMGRYFYAEQPAWGANGRLAFDVMGRYRAGDSIFGHIMTIGARGQDLRLVTRSMRDTEPDWSPTGRHIAFWRQNVASLKRDRFEADVFVARARGRGQRRPHRLTRSRDAFAPVWAPTGRYIAYVRAPQWWSAKGSLTIMRAADGGGQRLVAKRVIANRISWQPLPLR